MTTTQLSDTPQKAPPDFRALAAKIVTNNGQGLWETWYGSGLPSTNPCGHCGNTTDNLQIYGNWGHSYPNGNSWDDREIVCGQCGKFTLIMTFRED